MEFKYLTEKDEVVYSKKEPDKNYPTVVYHVISWGPFVYEEPRLIIDGEFKDGYLLEKLNRRIRDKFSLISASEVIAAASLCKEVND